MRFLEGRGHISEQEFAALMTEYRQRFYRIAYSYAKNEHDALDIVSEATYKGLKHIRSLKEPSLFLTWMTRIVINTAIDDVKRRGRWVALEDGMVEKQGLFADPPDEEILFDLYSAMDILEPEERMWIILKYFEEYSFSDISAMLGEPESTVKSRVYKCLRRMRTYMEGGERDGKSGKRTV
ncbi:hypothetical protein B5E84_07625 [Lachnoclostridium sp. An14]|uniref:sigma-70 family RNA polymerase sigma factor n=1 Tax=Lachnoclostridium sp. An14 TaxID=1965562 RepID=UPI000B385E20|nr:sigma-70 family RNA polymerase sigma factor [Lachnoclostridium sp. An14]OUQ18674.1 hypothetical protein B5E84_07625 [Lachnoclostridium sp. An14]